MLVTKATRARMIREELAAGYGVEDIAVRLSLHERFAECRVSDSREFFRVNLREAEVFLMHTQRAQISEWVNYFDEGLMVVDELTSVSLDTIEELAIKAKVEPYTVPLVLDEMQSEDLIGASARYFEKCRMRKVRMDAGIGIGSLDPELIAAEIEAKSHEGPTQ